MGMTITEKVLAKAAGVKEVQPGEIVEAEISVAMIHEGLGFLVYPIFRDLGTPIWDTERVVAVVDHAAPPSTIEHAEWVTEIIAFVEEYGIKHFYNMQGVCHQIIPEEGFVKPGMVAVGTDSHTCTYGALGAFATGIGSTEMAWVFAEGRLWFRVPETILFRVNGKLGPMVMAKDIILKIISVIGTNGATYKAMEFSGDTIRGLSMDGRLAICNMAVEAGAKNGIIEVDDLTVDYLKGRVQGDIELLRSDPDARYSRIVEIDAGELVPLVARPHSPANVAPVSVLKGQKVDQVLIGTCTGGRMEDFRMAAKLIQGRRIPRTVRCLILPASLRIYRQMLEEGLISIFAEAGCVLCNPHCGPCGGLHLGLIGSGEVCVGTHNRNFRGRMGSPQAGIYLASPATAAAAAVTGTFVDPRELEGA